jgi:hypothetical protein
LPSATTGRYVVEAQDAGVFGRYAVVDTRDGEVKRRTQTKGEATLFSRAWNRDARTEV